jgi:hypothetical protein
MYALPRIRCLCHNFGDAIQKAVTEQWIYMLIIIHVNFCFMGYNAVWSVESEPTFQNIESPPSSGSKNERNWNQHEATAS